MFVPLLEPPGSRGGSGSWPEPPLLPRCSIDGNTVRAVLYRNDQLLVGGAHRGAYPVVCVLVHGEQTVKGDGELDHSQESRVGCRVHLKYHNTGAHHDQEHQTRGKVSGLMLKSLGDIRLIHKTRFNIHGKLSFCNLLFKYWNIL